MFKFVKGELFCSLLPALLWAWPAVVTMIRIMTM